MIDGPDEPRNYREHAFWMHQAGYVWLSKHIERSEA